MKLYEINQEISDIIKNFTDGDGCISEEGMEQLEQLNQDFNEKALNIVRYIQNLRGDIKKAQEEENRITLLRKYREKKEETLMKYLSLSMENSRFEKRDLGTFLLFFRKSESVKITNEALIPDEFIRIKKEPDKTLIKKFLKTQECNFAEIERKKTLSIK